MSFKIYCRRLFLSSQLNHRCRLSNDIQLLIIHRSMQILTVSFPNSDATLFISVLIRYSHRLSVKRK